MVQLLQLSVLGSVDFILFISRATVNDDIPFETINAVFFTAIETARTYATSIDEILLCISFIGPILTPIQEIVAKVIPFIE